MVYDAHFYVAPLAVSMLEKKKKREISSDLTAICGLSKQSES